jgi:hypothetical protein
MTGSKLYYVVRIWKDGHKTKTKVECVLRDKDRAMRIVKELNNTLHALGLNDERYAVREE